MSLPRHKAQHKSRPSSQTKFEDSKSLIFHLRLYNPNTFKVHNQPNQEKTLIQHTQYLTASTFDNWITIKSINIEGISWGKIHQIKMAMPVVNTCLQLDKNFQPSGLVLCYFDGSIQYSPWSSIELFYRHEIAASKERKQTPKFIDIVNSVKRPCYINAVLNQSSTVQQAFMLETICFVTKLNNHIYAVNFKGEVKIIEYREKYADLKVVSTVGFPYKIACVTEIGSQKTKSTDGVVLAICFEGFYRPFLINFHPRTDKQNLFLRLDALIEKYFSYEEICQKISVKFIEYDVTTQTIVTCTQNNQINLFSIEETKFLENKYLLVSNLQAIFAVNPGDQINKQINDISVCDGILCVLCIKSFSFYDLLNGVPTKQQARLKEQLKFGKIVKVDSQKGKPLMLIYKKKDYMDKSVKPSNTMHLYTG